MLAVVTFLEKRHAYLADKEFTLRVDNVALRWLKTYSMDEGMLGRWVTALGRFNMRF